LTHVEGFESLKVFPTVVHHHLDPGQAHGGFGGMGAWESENDGQTEERLHEVAILPRRRSLIQHADVAVSQPVAGLRC